MAENQELENLRKPCELDEMGTRKISVPDQTNGSQFTNIESRSFAVDMERLSHPVDKDKTGNSRMARTLSRKGWQQGGSEKMINSSIANDRDTNIPSSASPRASLAGASTPEKAMALTVGTADHPINNPQVHHQITIVTGNIGGDTTTAAESRTTAKRFNFRRPPTSWTIGPRRILIFFATLSSMGTILLIYFTLSMGKLSGDDNALNW